MESDERRPEDRRPEDRRPEDRRPEDRRLDGNAAGGLLGEIFEVEMTTAVVVCASCGASGPVGATVVYLSALGAVVRCAGCGQVLIRVARVRGWPCVDIAGVAELRAAGGAA